MVKLRGERYKGRRKNSNRSTPAVVAPTPGQEDVYFTTRSTKDATTFQDTVKKLVWYVPTVAGWKQIPKLGEAMNGLRDPVFDQPTRPVRV